MERDIGSERDSSSTSERNPKVFVVAGTPESNKPELAIDIVRALTDLDLRYVDVEQPDTYALGEMADYRAELFHAFRRIFAYREWSKAGKDIIVSNSLLDSMAWLYTNTERRAAVLSPEEVQRDIVACTLVAQLCQDSFYADHVFLVYNPRDEQDEELFFKQRQILRTLNISYTILDDETSDPVGTCAKIVRESYE